FNFLGVRRAFAGAGAKMSARQAARVSADAPEDVGGALSLHIYTARSVLRGDYELADDRLTDALNREQSINLTQVELMAVHSPTVTSMPTMRLWRDEILIVEAAGPRGNERRRFRVSPTAVAMRLGPYHVRGIIHAVPGAHPILGLYH